MVPTAAVIPCPCRGISLASCVGGPGEYKGADTGIKRFEAVEGCARILHAVHIVNLRVGCGASREPWLIDPMQCTVRHGSRGRVENGWFIHIVPKAFDA